MQSKKKYKYFLWIIFGLFLFRTNFAQTKTNLERIQTLVKKSVDEISGNYNDHGSKNISFKFIASSDYTVLKPEVISALQKNNFKLLDTLQKNIPQLNYTVTNASVIYKDVFKDGIFGTYLVKRFTYLNGSYFFEQNNKINNVKKFGYVAADTVLYDDIKNLENIGYTFTTAELPSEPFFSSLLEPVIAIGTAAIAVYLFFTVRSK